jgi:hypothetical protein
MANPFIHYQTKNNAEYASIYTPRWKNGGKYNDIENLGRVIDKQNGIFRSRKRGLFKFTLKDGFIELSNSKYNIFPEKINTLIFGDVYISYKILLQDGYIDLFKNIFTNIYENIAPLILYRLLNNRPNIDAIHWWNGSYAKCLFPNAKLQSARISEYLTEIGSDKI